MSKKIGRGETETKSINDTLEVNKGINPSLYDEEPAFVNYKIGATLNMGNYESLRVDIGITRPCKNEDAVIEKVFTTLCKDVEVKLNTEIKRIKNKTTTGSIDLSELKFEEK